MVAIIIVLSILVLALAKISLGLAKKYDAAKHESQLKTQAFHDLCDLVWDHGVFMDSEGNIAAPGGKESGEIVRHWQSYHSIVQSFKYIGTEK